MLLISLIHVGHGSNQWSIRVESLYDYTTTQDPLAQSQAGNYMDFRQASSLLRTQFFQSSTV